MVVCYYCFFFFLACLPFLFSANSTSSTYSYIVLARLPQQCTSTHFFFFLQIPMKSNPDDYAATAEQMPPLKRAATETARRDSQLTSSTANARARFLRELEMYASDDEDDVAAVARSRSGNAANTLTRVYSPHALDTSPAVAAADDSDFFFSQATTHTGGDDKDDDNETERDEYGSAANSGSGVGVRGSRTTVGGTQPPPRVGLSLLLRMHAESTAAKRNSPAGKGGEVAACESRRASSAVPLEVVHAYVPLSTGGFLSTASAGEDLMESRQVRVGDVLSLRKLRSDNTSQPTAGPTITAVPCRGNLKVGSPASPTAPVGSSLLPPPPPQPATAASADTAQVALHRFKSAASFTDNDKEYGMRLSPDMVGLLFEVTRVDTQGRSVEALFLDGSRAKLAFREIRPAGYDERRRYAQWKADPSSRPVTTMYSRASSPSTASAPGTHSAFSANTTEPAQAERSESGTAAAALTETARWWVIPHLLVRVATEAAGDWYGKKCVVKTVRRKENAVRLTEWVDEPAVKGSTTSAGAAAETRELIGVDGLETVVPKKGGRAMVVLGPRKGEMCTVRSRLRGPDGDLTGVEVEMNRTKEVVTLQAEELCALARG